jgi:hypothetical protein
VLDRVEHARRLGIGGEEDDACSELAQAPRLDQRIVDQRNIRLRLGDGGNETVGSLDLAHELHRWALFERSGQRVAKQRLGVRGQDANTAPLQHACGLTRHLVRPDSPEQAAYLLREKLLWGRFCQGGPNPAEGKRRCGDRLPSIVRSIDRPRRTIKD